MKTLTVMRHAKSSWDPSGLSDRERPLNKRGERDAPVMGRRVADAGIRPSLILSSPAVRAWTTARIVAQEINYPLEFLQRENSLYLADVEDILQVLAEQDDGFNNIMLFGHNPGLTRFANFLVPGITDNLPTSGIVSVELETDSWSLQPRPATTLLLHDYPQKDRDVG